MGVVVRRYIVLDILTIIINFTYSTCISSFFGSSIPTSLFIFKMVFRSCKNKNKNKNKKPKWRFFYFAWRAPKLRYYGDVIHSFYWKSAVEHDGGV